MSSLSEGLDGHRPSMKKMRGGVVMTLPSDKDSLSEYQCLVREQLELFTATRSDIEAKAQGRNKPIILGQIGVRCRHCAHLSPNLRTHGSTYYPERLDGIYQASQVSQS